MNPHPPISVASAKSAAILFISLPLRVAVSWCRKSQTAWYVEEVDIPGSARGVPERCSDRRWLVLVVIQGVDGVLIGAIDDASLDFERWRQLAALDRKVVLEQRHLL